MRSAVIILALLVLVAAASYAEDSYVSVWGAESAHGQATSSWYGSTGLIVTPSAFTPPASAASIAAHWVNREPNGTWLASVNFGVTKDLEVGGAWIQLPGAEDDAEAVVNLKYHLTVGQWLGEKDLPDMAVGAFDVADQINRSIYFVLSKSLLTDKTKADSPRISLHAGWATSETGDGPMEGLFGGFEFTALKDFLVQAEYDGDAFNADLRYNLTGSVSLDVGLLDGDLGGGATYRSQF